MTLRVAVLGAGDHSQRNHLPALLEYASQHPGKVVLAALCDLRFEHAASLAKQYGFARVYANLDEMLAVECLDACIAVTPVDQTARLAARILEAGIPLLMEKPPGATLEEARQLSELAKASGLPVMVSFNRRFDPAIQVGLDWKADRPILYLRAVMARHARREPDFILGTAVHAVDALRYLGGEASLGEVRSRHVDGAAWAVVSFEFESGAAGSLEILPTAGVVAEQYEVFGPGYRLIIQVGGIDGGKALAWENGDLVLDVHPAQGQPDFVLNGTLAETSAFLDALLEDRPVQPTPQQTRPSVELCHAIYKEIYQETSS